MCLRFAAFFLLFVVLGPHGLAQQTPTDTARLQSPDGRLSVEVSAPDGQPHYRVMRDDQTVVAASRLGLRFVSGPNLDEKLAITALDRARRDETWTQPWGESETCTSCGKCVHLCPVGALVEKTTAAGEMTKHRRFLPYLTSMREARL